MLKLNLSNSTDQLLETAASNSAFTDKWFVVGSQQTEEYRFKQALMEYDTRLEHYNDNEHKIKKKIIELKIAERERDNEMDVLKKQLIEMDVEEIHSIIDAMRTKNRRLKAEINNFGRIINDIKENNPDIEDTFCSDEAIERYWVNRLGKQASIDLVSTGKITSGNLEAITQLPSKTQEEILGLSLQYAGNISEGMYSIERNISSDGKLSRIDEIQNTYKNIKKPTAELL